LAQVDQSLRLEGWLSTDCHLLGGRQSQLLHDSSFPSRPPANTRGWQFRLSFICKCCSKHQSGQTRAHALAKVQLMTFCDIACRKKKLADSGLSDGVLATREGGADSEDEIYVLVSCVSFFETLKPVLYLSATPCGFAVSVAPAAACSKKRTSLRPLSFQSWHPEETRRMFFI